MCIRDRLDTLEGDERTGAKIILKALEAPLFHIAANAGLEGSVIINKVREAEVGVGFDAYKEQYVDMIQAGILDVYKRQPVCQGDAEFHRKKRRDLVSDSG